MPLGLVLVNVSSHSCLKILPVAIRYEHWCLDESVTFKRDPVAPTRHSKKKRHHNWIRIFSVSPQRDWFSQCEHGTHAALNLNSCFQFRRKEIRVEHITVLWTRHARSLALILNSCFQFQSPQSNSSAKQYCEHGGTHAALSYSCFQFRRKETDSVEYKTVLWAWHARSLAFTHAFSFAAKRLIQSSTKQFGCEHGPHAALYLNSYFQFRREEIRVEYITALWARHALRNLALSVI